ncbi:MAG TPA: hypothetical protein VEX35_04850 [Allosphingosinicella sp.]|nr:hypothetical protein [Allosphingosinicella sp.]
MAYFASYKLPLLAAAALVAPTAAAAQDTGTRIVVIGAMQETADTGTRIIVIGASKDRSEARAEDPADRALPTLPVVYEDDAATSPAGKAPAAPAPAGR